MTKKYLLPFGVLLLSFKITAQTKIGNNPAVISSAAILEVEDTTRGILIPRMSSANRLSIASPPKGLLVYDTTEKAFYFYRGSDWAAVPVSSGARLDAISDADANTKIETEKTANEDLIHFTIGGTERWQMTGSRLENMNSSGTLSVGTSAGLMDGGVNTYSTYFGEGAGQMNVTGSYNTAVGVAALLNNTSGNNTAFGNKALMYNTSGSNNTAMGSYAHLNNKTGYGNVVVGANALRNDTAGNLNVAIGYFAGLNELGSNKLYIANSGTSTPLIYGDFLNKSLTINDSLSTKYFKMTGGAAAGYILKSNAAGVGSWVSPSSITPTLIMDADADTRIRTEATTDEDKIRFDLGGTERWVMQGLRLEPRNTGGATFIGEGAGTNDDGSSRKNAGIGYQALAANISGTGNTGLGYGALSSTTAASNTAVGYNAAAANTTGSSNVALGAQGLAAHTSGDNNIAVGANSLQLHQSGSNNVAVGGSAGQGNTTGSGNVLLGYNAGYSETGSNKLYIENSSSASPLVWGDFNTDSVRVNGSLAVNASTSGNSSDRVFTVSTTSANGFSVQRNGYVGIGTTAPAVPLSVITTSTSGNNAVIAQFGSSANQGRIKLYDESLFGNVGPKIYFDASNVGILYGGGSIAVMPSGYFGVNTLSPNATLTVNGSIAIHRVSVSANYTATASDYLIGVTTTSGVSIFLPDASEVSGRTYIIKAEVGGTPAILIRPQGGSLDGALLKSISTAYGVMRVYSDGNNWWSF